MLSSDHFFNDQAMRTLMHMQFGGADFGECQTTMQRVPPRDVEAWWHEWRATAERVAGIGDACAAAGHQVSAREAYLRASNYYRTAYLMHYGAPTSVEVVDGFERETAAFQAFAERADPPLEPLEIPYQGTTLPGYFCPASRSLDPAPLLIATNGYDSTLHEMYFAFAVAANRRGLHCLLFDGPGQGRALIRQGLTMRPDWEAVVGPVVDFALTRAEVDPRRIALAGWSFGGYLALRAAGGEHRLAACLADPGLSGLWRPIEMLFKDLPAEVLADPLSADASVFEPFLAVIDSSPELRWKIVQRGFWVHGVTSLPEYLASARDYTTAATASAIRCPVFLAQEEGDPLAATANEVFDALRVPKTLVPFLASEGAGDHCAMMGRSLMHQRMFDWLDEVFTVAAAG